MQGCIYWGLHPPPSPPPQPDGVDKGCYFQAKTEKYEIHNKIHIDDMLLNSNLVLCNAVI